METLTKKSFRAGNKEMVYFRPSQARKIPFKATSNREFIPSLKTHLKGLILEYESQLERDFLYLLDHDPNCFDLQPQPAKISYINRKCKKITIFPDCWAIFTNEREFLFEIKSEAQLKKLLEDENWELRLF